MPIPLLLLTCLVGELGLWFVLARNVTMCTAPVSAAVAVAACLLLRLAGLAAIWLLSRHAPSPAPRLGARQWLRLLTEEATASLFTFLCLLPFERIWMRPDQLRPHPHPVLLVHGYGCSRGIWWRMRKTLDNAGSMVATVSLRPAGGDIDAMAEQLARRIDATLAACDAYQLTLIGHSMGGLVCRRYLARYGSAKVAQLITLATPHQGSRLAYLGLGKNARQMQPNSSFLRALGAHAPTVPIVSLRTSHDEFVTPQDSQRLPGAGDVEVPACGHLALVFRRATHRCVLQLLAPAARPARPMLSPVDTPANGYARNV